MSAQEKTLKLLLDLGAPAARQTRTELLDRALQTSLALMDADAAVIEAVWYAPSSTPSRAPSSLSNFRRTRRN